MRVHQRSQGARAVAAAAYRAGELLHDLGTGITHDYSARSLSRSVMDRGIVYPPGAEWAADRERLWNVAEVAERRRNSCVAREYEMALPHDVPRSRFAAMIREFCEELVRRFGIVVDWALHQPRRGSRNVHVHMLTSTRVAGRAGFGRKTRELDDRVSGGRLITQMRATWAALWNREVATIGSEEQVDHRSYVAQDIDRVPQRHMGKTAAALERRGIATRVGDYNRQVREVNACKAAWAASQAAAARDQADLEQAIRDRDMALAAGALAAVPFSRRRQMRGRRRKPIPALNAAMPPLPSRGQPTRRSPTHDPDAHAAALAALAAFVQAAQHRRAQGGPLDAAALSRMVADQVAGPGQAVGPGQAAGGAPVSVGRRAACSSKAVPPISVPVPLTANTAKRARDAMRRRDAVGPLMDPHALIASPGHVHPAPARVRKRPEIRPAPAEDAFEAMLGAVRRVTRPAPGRPDLAWWWLPPPASDDQSVVALQRHLRAVHVETAREEIPRLGWGMGARVEDLAAMLVTADGLEAWMEALARATAASEAVRLLREAELEDEDAGLGLFGRMFSKARAAAGIVGPVLRRAGAAAGAEAWAMGIEAAAMARTVGAGVRKLSARTAPTLEAPSLPSMPVQSITFQVGRSYKHIPVPTADLVSHGQPGQSAPERKGSPTVDSAGPALAAAPDTSARSIPMRRSRGAQRLGRGGGSGMGD